MSETQTSSFKADVIEMTPHMLQHAGVVSEGNQYSNSNPVLPVASMLSGLSRQERELAVTGLVQTASGMLKQAIESGEPAEVMAGYKDQAAAIADLTKRIDVSKDAVLDAQVLQRRAERGLGVAIRAGQADGTIASRGTRANQGNRYGSTQTAVPSLSKPTDFATNAELYGDARDKVGNGIVALADTGTEYDFEDAVAEAREERNVSRANVVRKLKAAATESEQRRVDATEWHANLASKHPTSRIAYEAEGHERYDKLSSFQNATNRAGATYRFNEKSYAKHVATSQDRLYRASLSLETAIGVFEHIDLETITKEQAEDALQRIDTQAFNLIIRSLKGIANGK